VKRLLALRAAGRLRGERYGMWRRFFVPALLVMLATRCFASRTLVDELGRTVVVPDHPHRVICLMPNVTDTAFALGAGDDVVGISDYTRYPAEAQKKPSVGDLIKPSIETILSLHPDLVINMQPQGPMESTEQLERLGIPVFLVDPRGIAGILHSVESIGQALNRTAQADALVVSLQHRVDAVRARTKGLRAPTVFMPVWYDPIITIGKHAFTTEIIEAAGGRSVTDDLSADWPEISMEVVLARAPEALLLVRGGKTTMEVLQGRPGWSNVPAVQARRAYYVDGRIDFPSPVAINALEDLAKQFHP
jgi:ABC-type Fe3+-hydroxamate transport system substrate-binding protein